MIIRFASIFAAALAGMALASTAQAQERPMLVPMHDATVTYHLDGGRDAPSSVQVFYQAGGARVRVESDSQPGYILIDRMSGKAEMVMPGSNFGLETDIGREIDRVLNDPSAQFQRVGPGLVLNHPCTNWTLSSPNGNGQGCVTPDGLILSARGQDRKGHPFRLQALAVNEAPLPISEFAAPTQSIKLDSLAKFGKALRAQ